MAKVDKSSALLNLIQKAQTGQDPEIPGPDKAAVTPVGRATGKRTQVFLHDADRRIIRELVAYFAGQGRRVSESLVIKAALRTAKPGPDLLRAYEEAAAQDQRFKDTNK